MLATAQTLQGLKPAAAAKQPCSARRLAVHVRAEQQEAAASRRGALAGGLAVATALLLPSQPVAAALPEEDHKVLCDAACAADLADKPRIKTASGLEYIDLAVGTGPAAVVGYQVTVHYVAMTPEGRIFDSSLDKGYPYDIRVGTGAVVAGLDEGLLSMKVGGVRRLYIPGDLAFPNGLVSGPGRPRVPPKSPVIFDVQLLYIPGLSDDE